MSSATKTALAVLLLIGAATAQQPSMNSMSNSMSGMASVEPAKPAPATMSMGGGAAAPAAAPVAAKPAPAMSMADAAPAPATKPAPAMSMGGGAAAPAAPAAATPAARVACPTLPPAPAATKKFVLNAGTFAGSATQTLAYNGSAVGPLIRVRRGDLVEVDVTNKDIADGTSVHWHGQDLPNAAWADGVAGVSQQPVPPGGTFTYRFKAEPAGTFWYHSHTAEQFGDGLRGPLIVDDPNDPHKSRYDTDRDDHVLMLADVFTETVGAQLAALQRGGMGAAAAEAGKPAAESMMGMPANPAGPMGKMKQLCPNLNQDISDAPWYGVQVNGKGWIFDPATSKPLPGTAPLVINVERGKRHRLRLIGGVSSWALRFSVRNHRPLLIAADGRPIVPIPVQELVLTSGERADVVLTADQPVGNYWIDVATLDGQNSPAILHYKGAPDPLKDAKFLATARPDVGCAVGSPKRTDLKNATLKAAPSPAYAPPPKTADKQFTIYLADASSSVPPPSFLQHIKRAGNPHGLPATQRVPAAGPSCPPGADGAPSLYCWSLNWNVWAGPEKGFLLSPASVPAPRTYNVEVDQGDVVDLILVNPSLMVHPQHLHGTGFWLLAAGNGLVVDGDDKLRADVPLNLVDPPVRDTVPVPQAVGSRSKAAITATELTPAGYGYAVIRFRADNPGVWPFHCHIDLHAASGMFMTFTVKPPGGAKWALPANLECKA